MKVLVLSPHADDGELAMGGTIHRMVVAGHEVVHVLLSVERDPAYGSVRLKEFQEACKVLGCGGLIFESGLIDNEFDSVMMADLVGKLEKLIRAHQPDELYVPLAWFNQEHTRVWDAVMAAIRPVPNVFRPARVYGYELPFQDWIGGPLPTPRRYVSIMVPSLQKKLDAIACYKSQGASKPNRVIGPDGVKAMARLRGLEAGLGLAERFLSVLEIVK